MKKWLNKWVPINLIDFVLTIISIVLLILFIFEFIIKRQKASQDTVQRR